MKKETLKEAEAAQATQQGYMVNDKWDFLPLPKPTYLDEQSLTEFNALYNRYRLQLFEATLAKMKNNLYHINLLQEHFNYLSYLFSGQDVPLKENYISSEDEFSFKTREIQKVYAHLLNNNTSIFTINDPNTIDELAKTYVLWDYLVEIQVGYDHAYAAMLILFGANKLEVRLLNEKFLREFVEYLYGMLKENYIACTYEVFRNHFIFERLDSVKINWLKKESELIALLLKLDYLKVIYLRNYAQVIAANFINNKGMDFKDNQIRVVRTQELPQTNLIESKLADEIHARYLVIKEKQRVANAIA